MSKTQTMRIYVASLCDYNAGILHGKWIDVSDASTMQEEINAMMAESPTAKSEGVPAEEWAIHDSEGFGDYKVDETESLENLEMLMDGIDEHGEAFLAWAAHQDKGADLDKDDFSTQFEGEYKDLGDYTYEWWTTHGEWKESDGSHPSKYVDWDRMGEDLEINGKIWTANAGNGNIWVFSERS